MSDSVATVADTVKHWNTPIREAVRAVTALKFTDASGRVTASVPIAVVDGIPKSLAEVTNDIEPWQWWLVLNRPESMWAEHGLRLIDDEQNMLAKYLGDISAGIEAVGTSRQFITSILHHSVEEDILSHFKEQFADQNWYHSTTGQFRNSPISRALLAQVK